MKLENEIVCIQVDDKYYCVLDKCNIRYPSMLVQYKFGQDITNFIRFIKDTNAENTFFKVTILGE